MQKFQSYEYPIESSDLLLSQASWKEGTRERDAAHCLSKGYDTGVFMETVHLRAPRTPSRHSAACLAEKLNAVRRVADREIRSVGQLKPFSF